MAGQPGRSGGDRTGTRADPFPADGSPSPPTKANRRFKKVWREILGMLPAEILRRVDRIQLRALVELEIELTDLSEQIADDPTNLHLRRLRLATVRGLQALAPSFGLSPKDRLNLRVDTSSPEDSVLDQLLAKVR